MGYWTLRVLRTQPECTASELIRRKASRSVFPRKAWEQEEKGVFVQALYNLSNFFEFHTEWGKIMGQINISNSKGRDAVVNTRSITVPLRLRWLDEAGRQAESRKILKANIDRGLDALVEQAGDLKTVADLLIEGDPEIDFETFGSFLRNTSRAYIDPDRKIVHKIVQWDIIKNPDGSERGRRPGEVVQKNVTMETPLKWTGKMMKKEKIFNRFVFSSKMQITHFNGLTYDFLFAMAKELEEKESMMMIGAGPKSNNPLVFRRKGLSYRGFMEGRTDGGKYALILHLSNMELKAPSAE